MSDFPKHRNREVIAVAARRARLRIVEGRLRRPMTHDRLCLRGLRLPPRLPAHRTLTLSGCVDGGVCLRLVRARTTGRVALSGSKRGPLLEPRTPGSIAAESPRSPSSRHSIRADRGCRSSSGSRHRAARPASGSHSESAAVRAGAPQRAGAQRRSPRGSPVGTAQRSPGRDPGGGSGAENARGRAEAERVRRGTPSAWQPRGLRPAPSHAIYRLRAPGARSRAESLAESNVW